MPSGVWWRESLDGDGVMTMAQLHRVRSGGGTEVPVDPVLAGSALLLLFGGLIMVGSASTEVSARLYGSAFHMLMKHGFYMGVGLAAAFCVLFMPVALWRKLSLPLLVVSFMLLTVVLVPGVGREVKGAARWISFGAFSLQGSEFVKLFSVVFVAAYLVQQKQFLQERFRALFWLMVVLGLLVALLLAQPDYGTSVVIMDAAMGAVFLSGIPLRYFLPVVGLSVVLMVLLVAIEPYRLTRLTAFADPWQDQYGNGYQLTQALIAFGRGEWFGLGLGNSIQKLFFLPEAHNDFLFSIIAEELGIAGALVVITLFVTLVVRALWIGRTAAGYDADFHACLAWGIALLLGVQATINIGVNLGLLPTKGLTLPLMSYGGNSLLVSCVCIAILLRIEYEIRQMRSDRTARTQGKRRRRSV